jgi:putative mRNA 3-end processing factor
MNDTPLIRLTPAGLFCEAGGFFIDPWGPVARAVITHAHADHARPGSRSYLTAESGRHVLQTRMGARATIETVPFGTPVDMQGVRVSLHPAGHILGSAQVRVEHRGEVWVVSGDYKVAPDRLCTPFEPVRCHTFITESTFGLPIYRWRPESEIYDQINAWWRENQALGRASVIFGYSLGKAQRILAGLDPTIGPIYTHSAVETCNADYRATGAPLPTTRTVSDAPPRCDWSRAIMVAPPAAAGSSWMRRFGESSTAFASGWMAIRGGRRRQGVDRGFVLSDHADWPELLAAISATEAERVLVTHGYAATLARHLVEKGRDAQVLATRFGEREEQGETLEDETSGPVPLPIDETGVPNESPLNESTIEVE